MLNIKQVLRSTYNFLVTFGINPLKIVNLIRGLPLYFRDLKEIKKQQEISKRPFALRITYPRLDDMFSEDGLVRGHYFRQDLLIARRIYLRNPKTHVDIGSRIDGFVAHVAAFRHIEVIDIRPLSIKIPNVKFIEADLMQDIHEDLVDYCDSLSCLHALEHFGLGRYGDPVNYDGYLYGLKNMYKILQKRGKFYFSIPIGFQRIEFNAHRVFSIEYLLELFEGKYHIDHFSFIDDEGVFRENVTLDDNNAANNFGCHFGCGIFEMTKL